MKQWQANIIAFIIALIIGIIFTYFQLLKHL
nr:MAG TPA: Protein of unknown function (DUF1043) [Ackermannviridae sp.]